MVGGDKLLAGIAVIAALGLVWELQKAGPIGNTVQPKAARVSVATAAPEGGVGPGETALLGDGAARVFVSRVDADAARVAVNGLETAQLAVGDAAVIGNTGCRVTLSAVGGGKAAFGYACDS